MTIQNTSASGQTAENGASPAPKPTDVNQTQFLQLLVAQMKHQDPTNPTDGTAFVTQLAQFSELEQIVAIRGDIETHIAGSGAQDTAAAKGGN